MAFPYDIEIAPSDDCRKLVTQIMTNVGKFIESHDNGIKQAESKQIESYCESLLKEPVFLQSFTTYKDHYELEVELRYVKVKCNISRS